jgi:hypothetical protein
VPHDSGKGTRFEPCAYVGGYQIVPKMLNICVGRAFVKHPFVEVVSNNLQGMSRIGRKLETA